MDRVEEILGGFSTVRLLVVGDFILDRYIWGEVSRISPEAPVPVVSVKEYENRLGGAGNVASNLARMGVQVQVAGVLNRDEPGRVFRDLLREKGITELYFIEEKGRPTTVKTRVIAQKQQVVRIDEEVTAEVKKEVARELLSNLARRAEDFDGIILSDYAKGVLSPFLTQELIRLYNQAEKVVVVDPKGSSYRKYYGATTLKPNLNEFRQAVHRLDLPFERIGEYAGRLCEHLGLKGIVVTLGERGVYIRDELGDSRVIPTRAREVYDVSGAGDTFLAAFTAALILSRDWFLAGEIANLAAGVVVGKVGTSDVTIEEMINLYQSYQKRSEKNEGF